MPDGNDAITIRVAESLAAISPEDWDACAGTANPFVRHGFLKALEDSGSVTAETGWLPQHLIVEDGAGGIAACAPLYLKNHSYGEYVFDWAWAEAWDRAGGKYYPKLQSAVPFTPVTGPRLMVRPGTTGPVGEALISGMIQLAERLDVSSVHITFATENEWNLMGEYGLLQRVGQQFHWFNRDYATFDDFLADLSSRKRKSIRKERRAVDEAGVDIRTLRGAEISESHWDVFYRFYRDTSDRKWGPAYLNRAFFSELHAALGPDIVLIIAERDGETIGGALNLVGGNTLYGRYWGCLEHYKFLHFEVCYYRAIDFAIANGLERVEAGAQGPHKVQRGYLPVSTYSAHWIADTGFRNAVGRFIDEERRMVEMEGQDLTEASPFKKSDP
jgi:uncharacterized protein